MNTQILILDWYMLFHDEELDTEEIRKCFEKLDSKTLELIKLEYDHV